MRTQVSLRSGIYLAADVLRKLGNPELGIDAHILGPRNPETLLDSVSISYNISQPGCKN